MNTRGIDHLAVISDDMPVARDGVVESVLQTQEEARAELQSLFSDPAEVQMWLRHMPLRKEAAPV